MNKNAKNAISKREEKEETAGDSPLLRVFKRIVTLDLLLECLCIARQAV